MSFGSAPPTPDYTGAAREQAGASRQLTAEQTYANRPDITTPWGGIRWTPPTYDPYYGGGQPGGQSGGNTYSASGGGPTRPGGRNPYGPGGMGGRGGIFDSIVNTVQGQNGGGGEDPNAGQAPGRWGMEMYLNPEQQAALDAQNRIGASRSGLAEDMLGRVRGELGSAPDFSGLPAAPDVGSARDRAEQALYARQTRMLDPQFQQRQDQLDAQLRNQGIMPGTEAYQQQMSQLGREREQAYSGAREQAITGGGAEAQREFGMGLTSRQNALSEMLQRRGWSLNEVNALLSGQQIGMPNMPGFSQAGVSQAPNLLGAMQAGYQSDLNRYNAGQAQMQSMLSGGFGLAGAAMPFMF